MLMTIKKFRIQGKIYTLIEELPNNDPAIVKYIYKVKNSKKEEFTLIKSVKYYTLYKGDKVFTKTYSIKEI